MNYENFNKKQKQVFDKIYHGNTYSQLRAKCLHWLKMHSNHDGTKSLFMELSGIDSPYNVPSKLDLAYALMAMYTLDFYQTQAEKKFIDKTTTVMYLEGCLALDQ